VRAAIVLRSCALVLILFQVALPAGDMTDLPVFAAALLAGFLASALLGKRTRWNRGLRAALLILLPWFARILISLPGLFVPGPFPGSSGTAPGLDSLLLDYDRNAFVFLIPYYWTALSGLFSAASRGALRASCGIDLLILSGIYTLTHTRTIGLYRWPIVTIAVFGTIGFLELAALIRSIPVEYKPRRGEQTGAAALLLFLVVLGGLLFIRPSQEKAVEQGGGLLAPNLFSFDFSKFLKLESQISMNDDLVLIVKKDGDDQHILLRRYILSGYNSRQGFFRLEDLDGQDHPEYLPERSMNLPALEHAEQTRAARITNQEYYLVNFDSRAFIGMNQPVRVIPYQEWDASSFSSVYAVSSVTSEVIPIDLIELDLWPPSPALLDMGEAEYRLYTEYGGDERLRAYAESISGGTENYWDRVQGIYEWLKFGEYRYSLRAGIAPDGDQLSHFLFTSKKGYCSYFAFSFALLLRSLGIPARVGAGFFLDPETNTFDYYPVRADMAHAWVEVWFPGYGWIEYDPTTDILAEGEEFRISAGVPQELFEKLMWEIFNSRNSLRPKEGPDESGEEPHRSVEPGFAETARKYWAVVLVCVLVLCAAFFRLWPFLACCLARGKRNKAIASWNRALHLLRLGGIRRPKGSGEAEWARELDRPGDGGPCYELYRLKTAARFAPKFGEEDVALMKTTWSTFMTAYRRTVPLWRRVLAAIAAPAAWFLPGRAAGPNTPVPPAASGGPLVPLILLPLILLCAPGTSRAQDSYDNSPDSLLEKAQAAEQAEYWERAIELYTSGQEQYPQDIRFPWALGQLYQSRNLYSLAWDEYRRAEKIAPREPALLYSLAQTAGYLNLDTQSVSYLERLLVVEPDHRQAIGQLGWMYYKVHRQAEGDQLLRSAVERFQDTSPEYAMTLGTLNADMFRYDEGKSWYLRAIEGAASRQDSLFAAVAHYNLSILESRFYHFDWAFEQTNASLSRLNRSSGRLARGELYLRQLDLRSAFADYEAAYNMDSSPLSRLNLAQLYQIAGRLTEAKVYAEDCLKAGDMSWMMNYGIDPVRYSRDIHEILYKTYDGLVQTEKLRPYPAPLEWVESLLREIGYRFKAEVHRHLFRKYSRLSADAYDEPHPDSLIQYFRAFEGYPRRALRYLRAARDFEVPLIPASQPGYYYEEGRLMNKPALTLEALRGFDTLWERDMMADGFAELAGSGAFRRQSAQTRYLAEELYRLNPGAPRQRGIKLPVELRLTSQGGGQPPPIRQVQEMLNKAGIHNAGSRSPEETARGEGQGFVLSLAFTEFDNAGSPGWTVLCELEDEAARNTVLIRDSLLASASRRDAAAFARELADAVFSHDK
jgi:transglutaminase-like putative cysteine protease/tetratricopeptide (TPR) repeat protein